MAGPAGCAIAEQGCTNASVAVWVQKLMDAAYDYGKSGGSFGSAYVRNLIFHAMYTPKNWPDLATKLYQIAQQLYGGGGGNNTKRGLDDFYGLELGSTLLPELDIGPFGIPKAKKPVVKRGERMWGKRETDEVTYDYAFQAITCADAIDSWNTTTYNVFQEILSASQDVSEMCKSP